MKYDDKGNLILSGKLGEAVVSGEGLEEYAKALFSGRSENLSYQDMQDFQDFTSEFFVLGKHPGRSEGEFWLILLRKTDQAPFGLDMGDRDSYIEPTWEDNDEGFMWEFVPMQPYTIQGYEPAE